MLTAFSAPAAQANPNRCAQDRQYVGYGILAYTDASTVEGKEQLLRELMHGLERASEDCHGSGSAMR
jgi:hypothetical protein